MIKLYAKPDEIKTKRVLAGYSVQDLADELKVTSGAIRHLEARRNGASPKTAKEISEILGVEVEEIFEAVDNRK